MKDIHNCNLIGTELNRQYPEMAQDRITNDQPMMNEVIINKEETQ